jgi:hypothetical protein
VPASFNSIYVLSHDEPGDGGAAIWIRKGLDMPSHAARMQDAAGQWWELSTNQILNAKMLGAKGDADAAGNSPSEADDTGVIDTLLGLADEVYLPRGYYRVSRLMGGFLPTGKHLIGPGIAVSAAEPLEFNTRYYGDTLVAGTKDGRRLPVPPHGGFLIGGSGPTPEGTILRASNEGVNEFMPTRPVQAMQLQVYSNALQGDGTLNIGETATFTVAGKQKQMFVNDVIWLGGARYRISGITFEETDPVKHTFVTHLAIGLFDSTPLPSDTTLHYWLMYQHAEYTGSLDASGNFVPESGDKFEYWVASYDHNIIWQDPNNNGIEARFQATVTFTDTVPTGLNITNGPTGPIANMRIVHRWATGEDYISLFKIQGGAFDKEMIVAHYIRPDFAAMRIGATGQGTDDYVDYPDYHVLGEQVAGEPAYRGETNQTGEGFTYLTFRNGHVGVHERDPKVALHVSRHFDGVPAENGAIEKELATFKAVFGGAYIDEGETREDAEAVGRRLSVVVRNNFRAPGLQGYGPGTGAQAICIQPKDDAQSRCHFGSWDAVPDPYRFQFTGGVRCLTGLQTASVQVSFTNGEYSLSAATASVTVTAASPSDQILLPVAEQAGTPGAVPGHVVRVYAAVACKITTMDTSHRLNDKVVGSPRKALSLQAGAQYVCEYVANGQWLIRGFSETGGVLSPLSPD